MDLTQLRLFLHLADSLHFGKTSRACHLSPSALSRTIQKLEEECGCTLFQRDRRSVALTSEGQSFKEFATSTVQDWQRVKTNLDSQGATLKGDFLIYCSVTASYSLLPPILSEFRRRHPQVRVLVRTGDTNDGITKVLAGEADAAITPTTSKRPSRLITKVITRTPLEFIIPLVDCEVREAMSKKPVDWPQIPIVLPDRGIIRQRLLEWFQKKQIEPSIYSEVAGHEAIISLVSLGVGIAAIPKLALTAGIVPAKVEVIKVRPALPAYTVGVCSSQKLSTLPLHQAFWSIVDEVY